MLHYAVAVRGAYEEAVCRMLSILADRGAELARKKAQAIAWAICSLSLDPSDPRQELIAGPVTRRAAIRPH